MFAFLKGKSKAKTIVLIDIESGSVGGALVRIGAGAPRVFIQHRQYIALPERITGDALLKEVLELSEHVILHLSEAASRIRLGGGERAALGHIEGAVVLLGAPWADVRILSETEHSAGAPKTLTDRVRRQCYAAFGDITVRFQAFATAASRAFSDLANESLLAVIGHEVTELLATRNNALVARATFPSGTHTLLRTLKTHAGTHPHEAQSALHLTTIHGEEPFTPAAQHFAKQFADAVTSMLPHATARDIVIIAEEPYAEWHARALVADTEIGKLFEEGGVVRALRPSHLKDQVLVNAPKADVFLTIGALYAGTSDTL